MRMKNKINGSSFLIYLFVLIISILSFFCNTGKEIKAEYILKNGLIYKNGSDTAYTGRVKTVVNGSRFEYDVVKGKKTGELKIFDKNGSIAIEGNLKDNKNIGTWKYYYPGGELESVGDFVDDMPDGKWIWYYKNGKPREIGYFSEGEKDSTWFDYDEDGHQIKKYVFKNGEEINF